MVLSDSQLETLKTAVDRYGVTTVRNFFGITQPSLYNAIHRKNGMSSKNLLKLEELRIAMLNNRLPSGMQRINSNAPSVAMEATQADTRSDTAGLLRLLYMELPKLSETNLAKVYRYVVELQIKQEAE